MDIWDLEFEIKYSHKAKKYTFIFTPYLEKRASYHIDDEINANNMKYEEDSDNYTPMLLAMAITLMTRVLTVLDLLNISNIQK